MDENSTFSDELAKLEADTERAFLKLLSEHEVDAKNIDLQTFGRIIRLGHFIGISAGEFADRLGVRLSNVSRWRTDVDLPGLYIRRDAIAFIREWASEPPPF